MKGLLVGWLARVKSPFLESVKARPIARQAELPKKKIRPEKAPFENRGDSDENVSHRDDGERGGCLGGSSPGTGFRPGRRGKHRAGVSGSRDSAASWRITTPSCGCPTAAWTPTGCWPVCRSWG